MVFADYFSWNRAKQNTEELKKTNPKSPVLNEQDELFLQKVTSKDAPMAPLPPLPDRPVASQDSAEAEKTALPDDKSGETLESKPGAETSNENAPDVATSSKRTWASYVPAVPNVPNMPSMPSMPRWATKDNPQPTSQGGPAVGQKLDEAQPYPSGVKVTEDVPDRDMTSASAPDADSESDEHKEVSVLLDKLNLSSINNRVFAFSAQTQKIYQDFTVVLKDLINGVPTAYDDMERLLRDNEGHLSDMFANMPPFVQTLVKSVPTSIAPAILSAAGSKPDPDAELQAASTTTTTSKRKKRRFPDLKGMTQQKGAVATMLTNIVNFLKVRFPLAVTGTNVVMSMAVLILLFVLFYCHKRGRETRLENAAKGSEDSESDAEEGLGDASMSGGGLDDEKAAEGEKDKVEDDTGTATRDV